MEPAKNPLFLVDIFKEIHEINKNTIFFHVGDGKMMAEMKARIREKNLESTYILLERGTIFLTYLMGQMHFYFCLFTKDFPLSLLKRKQQDYRVILQMKLQESVM